MRIRLARLLVQAGLASGLGLDGCSPGLANPKPVLPALGPAIAQSAPPVIPSPSPTLSSPTLSSPTLSSPTLSSSTLNCAAPCAAISPPTVPGLSSPPPYRWNSTLTKDTLAQDALAQDALAQDTLAQDTLAQDTLAQDALAQDTLAQDTLAQDVIILGRLPQHPYRVAIPGNNPSQLQRLRPYIADALILSSPRGPYLQAASFRDRPSAEAVSRWLHQLGFSEARVIYWR